MAIAVGPDGEVVVAGVLVERPEDPVVAQGDVRVAAESAEFAMGQVPTGLLGPYWLSAAESLPWCIAAELALLGDRIDARRALQYGLLNEVVPDEQLMDVAMGYATRLLALPPLPPLKNKPPGGIGSPLPMSTVNLSVVPS